jgi:outer membrane protein assembly factor BamB
MIPRSGILGRMMPAVMAVILTTTALGANDDWPRYGHDPCLTGRSPLKGQITSPRVSWTQPLAGRELLIEIFPETGEHPLRLSAGDDAPAPASPRMAIPGPAMLDVDGSGSLRPAAETYHERWAKVLPNVRGLQRTAWSHTWTTEKVCRLQLFAYDQGFDKPRMVWQSDPPEETIFQPLNVVYDIDGDGVQEICTAAHYRVMIFEGTTGRKETELKYHTCRPYGWFGLVDVDGDGQMELVTIGDFQSHMDVLKYDPRKPEAQRLSVLWRRDIETDISQRRKWPQIGPEPVVNVTGDARPELVLNLFNDTGDGQWHAVVLDAATGKSLCDMPKRFCQGTADVDQDGARELFLTASDGVFVPTSGRVELIKIRDNASQELWSHDDARWVTANLPTMGPTWSTTASGGMRRVLTAEGITGQGPVFAAWIRDPAVPGSSPGARPTTTLAAMHYRKQGGCKRVWQINGLTGESEALHLACIEKRAEPAALLRTRLAPGTQLNLTGKSAKTQIVHEQPLGLRVSPPIAARLKPGGAMTVIAEGAGENVFAIEAPGKGQPARIAWQRPGRAMADGGRSSGPLAADLKNDGGNEVVVAGCTPSGEALLIAYDQDGGQIWQRRFGQVPGSTPVWNEPALTQWWPGHFRNREKLDLFVNTRRGPMHSDIGHLIDGANGETIWTHDKAVAPGQFQWGYAGIPLAVADLDGNGTDDLVNLYPVDYWVADGATGDLKVAKDLASRKDLPAWAAYGEPMVHDFNGDGRPEVLLDCGYILALLDVGGKPIWHGPARAEFPTQPGEGNVGEVTGTKHALIDLDGDGTFEIASAGYADGVRAFDPRDGKKLWSLAAPAPTCARCAAADIDGRPGDELLYVAGDTLVVVAGDRKAGRILWTWKGPAALSLPAIADVDGDGQAEIILQTADASVVCLDSDATR